jgi:DNA-binding response OmpR family regulator
VFAKALVHPFHKFIGTTEDSMRILIVEDEEDLATALARGLRKEGYAVDLVGDGLEGWQLADATAYDILLLDLNLPGMDGLDLCRQLRMTHPELRIVMVTAREQPNQRIHGLDSGADDYIVKPFHFGELVARLRALLRRDIRNGTPLLTYADLAADPVARTVWRGGHRLDLTAKEFAIVEYFLRHIGEIVSQEELIEHVWDRDVNPFTTTVRAHMATLRRKLGQPGLIETLVGQGYRLGIPIYRAD